MPNGTAETNEESVTNVELTKAAILLALFYGLSGQTQTKYQSEMDKVTKSGCAEKFSACNFNIISKF